MRAINNYFCMIYKGVGGSFELLEDRLIIRRTMVLGTLLHGLSFASYCQRSSWR
jgi:hypothetical protein